MKNSRKVLFVTHDSAGPLFDRRITDQARIFENLGWQSLILCQSSNSQMHLANGMNLIGLNAVPPRIFYSNFLREIEDEENYNKKSNKDWQGDNVPSSKDNLQKDLRIRRIFLPVAKMIIPTMIKKTLKPYLRALLEVKLKSERIISQPQWVIDSARISYMLNNFEFDLVVACDLPAAIGVFHHAIKQEIVWWFDAHEIFTEQTYIKKQEKLETLIKVERKVVENATYFSTVNKSALEHMSKMSNRQKYSFVFTNATKLTNSYHEPRHEQRIRFVFHGGLSSQRSLFDFIRALRICTNQEWSIDLIGWDPDPRLFKLTEDSRIRLNDPIPTSEIHEEIRKFDCIVLPYKIIDLNTQLAMPNKLGDAIALRIPVIFNEELVEVNRMNCDLKFGASFRYGSDVTETAKSIDSAIDALRSLNPNWDKVEKEMGHTHNVNAIRLMIDNLIQIELKKSSV